MLQTATVQPILLNAKSLGQQPITSHHYYQQQHQHTSKFNNNRMNEKQIQHPTIKSSRLSYPETKMHRSEQRCNRPGFFLTGPAPGRAQLDRTGPAGRPG
ncbi:unnamed protein product [Rotaria magnacalcarata]|uniref:Uncharacterized protein n=1 Tax=Rotaria magnacalcarata TaxID=392030 RepID=A0A816CPD7_9BILA|nr:unnamed protein product [Rotaria magnacalcarata]CAF2046757.1 unnamed protein product [Rotaria magnacalcarata]CAF3999037.1 unnamed protein product [Rotaria magnacalcarata]CAF5177062.1 unnamed protein product [Rotaria magnacalcarata]